MADEPGRDPSRTDALAEEANTANEDVPILMCHGEFDAILPLWGEADEEKRIAGWKAVDKYIAEEGYVIPLIQYVQPVVYKSSLDVTPNVSGALHPHRVKPA
mgnify:CR=1 FL=1